MPESLLTAAETVRPAQPAVRTRFFARLPRAVWLIALAVAALHMAPHFRAVLAAPDGWQATGNLMVSPDFMQYRVWMRQSLEEGPIVSNRFTTEPNRPYLPVPFYFVLGRIAQATGVAPEWVFAWVGAALAFLLTILLFATARYFLRERVATWTAFWGMLIGGGLGGYLLLLRESSLAVQIAPIRMVLLDPFRQDNGLLEQMRGDYVFSTLFDTHFLLIWLLALSAILSFYATLRSFRWEFVAGTAVLFAIATVAHVYEGITLLMIAAGVTLVCRLKRTRQREALLTMLACAAAVGAVFLWIAALMKGANLPLPDWRGIAVHPLLLFMGFPLAWLLLAWGGARYWRNASLEGCFLLGWIAGCTALTLSAPFYPWPNRGVLSLQVPLTIIAASIWFTSGRKLNARAIVVVVLLMGSTATAKLLNQWRTAGFDANAPHKFMNAAERRTVSALRVNARKNDVLIAGFRDRLWLAPEYSGRHYAGHFFLTVDYESKQAEVDAFYAAAPAVQESFLRSHHIRFVYVNSKQNPLRFRAVPGLVPVYQGSNGTLFEFAPTRRESVL